MLGTVEDPAFRLGPIYLRRSWLVRLIHAALVMLGRTWRIEVEDRAGFFDRTHHEPYIFVLWHNRMAAIPEAFRRFYGPRKGASVLTSASGEGTVLALLLERFGIGAVRGSTSRQGAAALREMEGLLREGKDLAITPDGPRGPRYVLQPGPAILAKRTGCAVLPLRVRVDGAWRLNTWDRFFVPKPFARVRVHVGPVVRVGPDDDLGKARLAVERALVPDAGDE